MGAVEDAINQQEGFQRQDSGTMDAYNRMLAQQQEPYIHQQPPTDAFMDEIYNQGLMDQLMQAFQQSGQAPPFSGDQAHDYGAGHDPFFKYLGDWARKEQGGNMMDLIHPLLRGQPGPLPPR